MYYRKLVMLMTNLSSVPKKRIWLQVAAYVAPVIGYNIIAGSMAVLAGIYAKYYGFSLTEIATVMLVARLFDAITDPIIGFYSDFWRAKSGTRKPLIFIGTVSLILCGYFLFLPPEGVGMVYFTFWFMAFYLAWTAFYIPHLAWAHEFTAKPQEKSLVFSAYVIASQVGAGLFFLLPVLPFFDSTEVTPQTLKASLFVGSLLLLPGLYAALKFVPNGSVPIVDPSFEDQPQLRPVKKFAEKDKLTNPILTLLSNKPFLLYMAIYACSGLAIGMWWGMLFIYVDVYLQLGGLYAELLLWGMIASAVTVPIWYRLSLWLGKRNTWLVGMFSMVMGFLFLSALEPGRTSFIVMLCIQIATMIATVSNNVISLPILCDIIDYGRLQDGSERSAMYFSMNALVAKLQVAFGGALALGITGWFGFNVTSVEHSELSLLGLHLAVSWIPVVSIVLAMVLIAFFPLSERRMKIIHRRLDCRMVRAYQETKSPGDYISSVHSEAVNIR